MPRQTKKTKPSSPVGDYRSDRVPALEDTIDLLAHISQQMTRCYTFLYSIPASPNDDLEYVVSLIGKDDDESEDAPDK